MTIRMFNICWFFCLMESPDDNAGGYDIRKGMDGICDHGHGMHHEPNNEFENKQYGIHQDGYPPLEFTNPAPVNPDWVFPNRNDRIGDGFK